MCLPGWGGVPDPLKCHSNAPSGALPLSWAPVCQGPGWTDGPHPPGACPALRGGSVIPGLALGPGSCCRGILQDCLTPGAWEPTELEGSIQGVWWGTGRFEGRGCLSVLESQEMGWSRPRVRAPMGRVGPAEGLPGWSCAGASGLIWVPGKRGLLWGGSLVGMGLRFGESGSEDDEVEVAQHTF